MFYKYILPICGFYFYSLNNVFQREVLNFDQFQISICSFVHFMFLVPYLKNFRLIQGHKGFPMLFSTNLIVLGFTLLSMIQTELIFEQSVH